MVELSPINRFRARDLAGYNDDPKHQDWYVKREDLACFSSPDYPSGSKVRQYVAMAQDDRPMLVGCSAESAMQIYVAAAAKQFGVKAIIYTAKRAKRTASTEYAIRMGAEVNEIPHGYLNVVRSHAHKRGEELGGKYVFWDKDWAIEDARTQCANLPPKIKRIVIPTGSGLTAAGVLAAVPLVHGVKVVIVAVSQMADLAEIKGIAKAMRGGKLPPVQFIAPTSPYDKPVVASLPDGTPLDPFYAAKALRYVKSGDLLWPPGLRPVSAMPAVCQKAFANWPGPPGTKDRDGHVGGFGG